MQRKLNTKFLVVMTIIVVGGLLVLIVGGRYLFRGTAQKHIQMAELYEREGRLADAAEEYKLAISLDRRNPEIYLKLGDVVRQLTRSDPTLVDKDKSYWTLALEADPSYLPAMQRLLDSYLEDAQLYPNPHTFGRIRDVCSRILHIDPNDSRAKSSLHIALIQSWLSGVETSDQEIEASLKEMADLQQRDPQNLEVPFMYARAKVKQAKEFFARDFRERANKEIINAEAAMQEAIAANPENPRAHLRHGQIMMEIAALYRRDPEKFRQFRNVGAASITRAQELVKKDESAFLEVNMAAALLAHQEQRIEDADKIYREMLGKYPDDRSIRIAYAQLLATDPNRRDEAISLLEENVNNDATLIGARVRLRADMEIRTQLVLAGLRIDALAASKDDAQKEQLLQKINQHLTEIYNRQGESPEYLRLKGRLFQAQNQFVDAIQTYNRAAAMLAQLGRPQDDDMMYQLARVYIAAQQTGEARTILEEIVRKYEMFNPARILLCRVLLAEGSREAAIPHLRYLEQVAPDDPQVTALLLSAARGEPDSVKTSELLDKLPEGTRAEKIAKARAAMEAGQVTVSHRIANELLLETPGDEEAAQIAIQSLLRENKSEDARKIIEDSLAANPESRSLKLMKAQLDGSGEQLVEVLEENVEQIKDEFTRELAKARLAEARGQLEEAHTHLKRAEEIKPDSPEVWDQLFQHYARTKEWDKLQQYMDKLTAANHDRANGLLYQFRLQMAKNEVEEAVETARQLTARLPEFAQSWLALAQGLQSARKYDEAREAYLRVLEKQAMNLEAYRGLVQTCYLLRRYDDAGRYIADARKRMPSNLLLRNMEIEHELNFGRPERVIGLLEEEAAKRQEQPEAWLTLGRAYERILQRKASRGDDEVRKWATKLRDHFAKAFERWPENPDFAGRYADACVFLNDRPAAEKVLQAHASKTNYSSESVIMLADYYLRGGEFNHAEMTIRKALEQNSADMGLWKRLAGIQLTAGRPDDALKTLGSAPDQDAVLMQKLEIMLNTGKIAEAKSMIQQALKTRGEDFGLVNAQAYIALQENDLAAARAFADKSLMLKPNNPIALHQRALVKLREEQPDVSGAIVDLKVAIQQAPTNVELRLTASEAYLRRRDRDSAIRELEVASSIAPRNQTVWSRLMDLYLDSTPPRLEDARQLIDQVRAAGGGDLELTVRAARVAQLRRDAGVAITEMRRAISMSNGNPVLIRDYMVMLLDLQQYDHLLKESEQLLEQAPNVWWVRDLRATAKSRLGRKDDALNEWEQAIVLADKGDDPNAPLMIMQRIAQELGVAKVMPDVLDRAKRDPRWVMFAAWLYQSERDWHNAVKMVDQALSQIDQLSQEDQHRALQVAGAVYLSAQPPLAEKAIDVYNKLLERDPEDLLTLNNLACLYIDNVSPSQPAKALEYSQRAYDVMRKRGLTEPLVMDTHGWVLANNGKVQEGIVLLQEVVQRRSFLEARYHLAEAYLKGKYVDSAIRQLNEANQLISEAEARRQPVDPQMKAKVEQAMARAVALSKEEGDVANP